MHKNNANVIQRITLFILIYEDRHFLISFKRHDVKIHHHNFHKFHVSLLNNDVFNINCCQVDVCIEQNVNENSTTKVIMQKNNALTFHERVQECFHDFLQNIQCRVLNMKIIFKHLLSCNIVHNFFYKFFEKHFKNEIFKWLLILANFTQRNNVWFIMSFLL